MSSVLEPAPSPFRPRRHALDDRWMQWAAENLLRDATPESMVGAMVAAGLDRDDCLAAVTALERDPVYLAARRHQQLLRKLESVVDNLHRLQATDPAFGTVEKRESIPRDEFMQRYVRGCRPVVITGLARDWPALTRWTPEGLKQRFGHLDVEIQAERNADPKFEQNKLLHRRIRNFGAFIDQVLAGGHTNDYYMTANNLALRRPEFAPLLQDVGSLPEYVDAGALSRSASFWFGPGGTITPLHHDTFMLLHTQVLGRKRWRFVSPLQTPRVYNFDNVFSPVDLDAPDLARYPAFAQATVLDVTVEPGETIFLPLGWWHQVTSLDLSVSLSYTNIDAPNSYTFADPRLSEW